MAPAAMAGPDDDVVNRRRRNAAAHMLESVATAAHALVVVEVDFLR